MKVEAIPNKGPASIGSEITECFDWARNACIASAFLTLASLERIEESLISSEKNHTQTEIRLLVGLYQRFTSAETIVKACNLQKRYPDKFWIRIARNSRFHWKLYIFTKDSSRRIYIGSANFTEDGLTASGELSVKITSKTTDQISKSLQHEFNSLWENKKHSFFPDDKFLRNYKKLNPPSRQFQTSIDKSLSNVLYNAERPPRKKKPSFESKVKARVIFAVESLSAESINKVSKRKNNWEENNWDYVCLQSKYNFDHARNSNLAIYVTHYGNSKRHPRDEFSISLNRIEDSVILETDDGKYFVAFSKIPYSREKRYGELKAELSKIGLTWKQLSSDKSLNEKQIKMLCDLFQIKWSTLIQKLA
jgi:HKD family nuclease